MWPLRHVLAGLVVSSLLPTPSVVFAQNSQGQNSPLIVGAQPAPAPETLCGPNAETPRGHEVKDRRELRHQEFLRDHTAPSGRGRPALWRRGVAEPMHMQSAPAPTPSAPLC